MEEAGHTAVVPPLCCGNDDHDNQPGAVKTLTETQEGNRRRHVAAGLLGDQRPQPGEERRTRPRPP